MEEKQKQFKRKIETIRMIYRVMKIDTNETTLKIQTVIKNINISEEKEVS